MFEKLCLCILYSSLKSGVLCNAAYGNGNVAEVAAYAQMDESSVKKLMETVKTFGSESIMHCWYIYYGGILYTCHLLIPIASII